MKLALGILMLVLAAQAKADFVSLPIQCRSLRGINGSNTDQMSVKIVQPGDSLIVAIVKDHNDVSRMQCRHVTTGATTIECQGVWASDNSPAQLTATTSTYVPFVRVLRSETAFQGATDTSVCIEGGSN